MVHTEQYGPSGRNRCSGWLPGELRRGCPGSSDFSLYEVSYREGSSSFQRVPNESFEFLLLGWGYWSLTVQLVTSDQGTGSMLSVAAGLGEVAHINSAPFPVTPGGRYTLGFEARVSPNSEGGYFSIFFQDPEGGGPAERARGRERILIEPAALRYSSDCDSSSRCLTVLPPASAEAYYDRGLSYGRKRDYARAKSDFDKAIELNSTYQEAYFSTRSRERTLGQLYCCDRRLHTGHHTASHGRYCLLPTGLRTQ